MSTENTVKQKKDLFLKRFAATLGNISEACKAAGISRSTYYNWTGRGPKPNLKDAKFIADLEEVEEQRTDFVASQELKLIQGYTLPETKVYFVQETTTKEVKGKLVVTKRMVPVEVPGVKHVGPSETLIKHYLQAKARNRGYGKEVTVKHKATKRITAMLIKEATGPAAPPAAAE